MALAAVVLCLALSQASFAAAEETVASTTASTDVELAVVSSFQLARVASPGAESPDYVGALAGAQSFALEARAEHASGAVAGWWTRMVDGVLDEAFSAAGLVHSLVDDELEGGRVYRYTLTATDQAGTARSVDFDVDVRYRGSNRVAHAPGSDLQVDVAGEVYHDGESEASLYVKRLGGSSSPGDALNVLVRAAAERGKSVEAAWSVGMTVPAGVDASPFVGALEVSFPYPVKADFWAKSPFMLAALQAGPDVLFLAAGDDEPVLLSTVYAQRRAAFETGKLGAFVVLSGGPAVTHVITAAASPGGSIDPAGSVAVQDGEDATFVFSPDDGYAVDDVKVDGVSCGPLASYTFVEVVGEHTVEVSFARVPPAPIRWTLDVSAGEGGAVRVGSQVVEGSRAFQIEQGSAVSLAFMPASGWRVDDVRVNGVSVGRPASYAIASLSRDTSVEVAFARGSDESSVMHTVEAQAGEGGSVSPQSAQVPHGGDATFSFIADDGYRVSQVLVDGQPVDAVDSLTLHNVTADHVVRVLFQRVADGETGETARLHTVSASAGPHGAISPAGEVEVAEGSDATFSFLPEAGYEVARVIVDGQELAFAPRSWTFSNVREAHALKVEFRPVSALTPTGDARNLAVAAVAFVVAIGGLVMATAAKRRSKNPK